MPVTHDAVSMQEVGQLLGLEVFQPVTQRVRQAIQQ